MSRISFGEISGSTQPFGIYVPSGMLSQRGLTVSWASGKKATSQIDWGFDINVPDTTPVQLLQPGDDGYVEGKQAPKLSHYHLVSFPETQLNQWHYFRCRSTRNGQTRESQILRAHFPKELALRNAPILLKSYPATTVKVAQRPPLFPLSAAIRQPEIATLKREGAREGSTTGNGSITLGGQTRPVTITNRNTPLNEPITASPTVNVN
jgi:hypothetical protein